MAICGAKRRNGEACQKPPLKGKSRCRLHGGSSSGAPKGNQHNKKHGIYARLFEQSELDQAASMAGSLDTELAIARLQLRNLIEKMQADRFELRKVEVKVMGVDGQEEYEAKVKGKRARDAERCGEYYDPDDDDYGLEQESAPLEIKRTQEKRDWPLEYIRLTKLIESLELKRLTLKGQTLDIELKHIELEKARVLGTDEYVQPVEVHVHVKDARKHEED